MHALKYEKKFRAGIFLGEKIAEKFNEKIKKFSPDMIIPVPLHKLKKAERGYNQAFYIAEGIARLTGAKVKTGVLKRVKFTETQTQLNSEERRENVKSAFEVKKKNVLKNKNVILVDDVTTTGATTTEAARELKKYGAGKIMLLTVAIPEIE